MEGPLGYFLTPDWNDVAYVTVTLVDNNGTVIPDSETRVHFSVAGPAKIIAVDNGNLLDHDPFQATDRKLYEGHAFAILRATASSATSRSQLPPKASTRNYHAKDRTDIATQRISKKLLTAHHRKCTSIP